MDFFYELTIKLDGRNDQFWQLFAYTIPSTKWIYKFKITFGIIDIRLSYCDQFQYVQIL